MNINVDDDIRANHAKFQKSTKRSALKWILIVATGVFIGATASTLSIRAMDIVVLRIQLNELNKEMAADRQREQAKREEERKTNAAIAKQRQIENEKIQAGLRQALETCKYWQDSYRQDPSNQNKIYMDEACDLVAQFR